ncbi:MAG: hypothetical protein HYY64_07985 [Candidatus Rokubacteria bacterium]|nr:hypothetical protein [Candidatus Rokubacteria bacterium]
MGFKLVSVALMVGMVLSGPLAPLAWAQEKTEGQMAPAKKDDGAWEFGAAVVNTVHVPGKAVLCGLGAVSGVAVLLLTFGSGYAATARIWEEGCAGRWAVTAADLKPQSEETGFLMDRPDYRQEDYQRTQ